MAGGESLGYPARMPGSANDRARDAKGPTAVHPRPLTRAVPDGGDPVVVDRVRVALAGSAGSALVFAVSAPWLAPTAAGAFVACSLAAVLLLGAALAWLRRRPSPARAVFLGETTSLLIVALSILAGTSLGQRFTTPMIPIVVAMATGAFIPWGVGPQVRVAAFAALGIVLHVAWLGATQSGYPTVVSLIGIGLSIPMAATVARDRARILALAEHSRATADALHQSERRYAGLLENAPDPILTFDARGRVRSANPATVRLLGWPAADLLALRPFRFVRIVAPHSRATVLSLAARLAERGGAPPAELDLVCRDGGHVLVECNQRLLAGGDGDSEVEVILRDITERRRAEEASRLRALNAHMETVREDGRRRWARRLHDELAQPLAALRLEMSWLLQDASRNASPEGLGGSGEASTDDAPTRTIATLVESVIAAARSMIADLHPSVLDDFGIAEAVRWQARTFEQQTGVLCAAEIGAEDVRCSREHAVALFRSLQETLEVLGRASDTRSIEVALHQARGAVLLTVRARTAAWPDATTAAQPAGACAIDRMRERARLLGGDVVLRRPAAGTVELEVRVPAERPRARSSPHTA